MGVKHRVDSLLELRQKRQYTREEMDQHIKDLETENATKDVIIEEMLLMMLSDSN